MAVVDCELVVDPGKQNDALIDQVIDHLNFDLVWLVDRDFTQLEEVGLLSGCSKHSDY